MNREKYLPLTETTYYILLSLLKPAHGYLIMKRVEELSKQNVVIAAGTLYGAIENLTKQKLIKSVESDNKRRKIYVITDKGKEVLKLDYQRMQKLIDLTDKLLID
ncbi:PadR family transcriptional regulator [Gracilibacillus thailandensis]|uniref:PadR family transcriptional regulator n=1 Tax=Gracilibacillus thailandensis TaxID=563735 RepID=A0A6N7R5C7_9BACI|nr:PadR family transcriptional regulator [Gracilibacillus thailandensis]MRI68461.1 PadR family transcriptional regulator [Gracilibacillus thailandensis]